MSIEYRYFKITGGKVKAAFDRWTSTYKEQQKARVAWRNAMKATGTFGNDVGLAGLVYEDSKNVPLDWKLVRGQATVYRPHGNSQNAKNARIQMRKLPLVGLCEFQDFVFGDNTFHRLDFMHGIQIWYMHPQMVGDTLILCVPNTQGSKWKAPDKFCREMKTSEYWKLKEANPRE